MKKVDRIGERFGRLTIVEEKEPKLYKPRTYARIFLCKCDCGNMVVASYTNLKVGNVRSCGCLKKVQPRRKNYTGIKRGRLTVIKELENGDVFCKCECGNKKIIKRASFASGSVNSCGCLLKEIAIAKGKRRGEAHNKAFMDSLMGRRFNKLVVIGFKNNKPPTFIYEKVLCKCDCGNEKWIIINHLKHNEVQSCGCLVKTNKNRKKMDITPFIGKKFGRWTILGEGKVKVYKHNRIRTFLCRCECGREEDVAIYTVLRGRSKSCKPCMYKHRGEKK
jgi:hypothetical protein